MTTITIQDLDLSKTLDRQAMAKLSGGGYTHAGSSNSYSSWSFVGQLTKNGGFRQIGLRQAQGGQAAQEVPAHPRQG